MKVETVQIKGSVKSDEPIVFEVELADDVAVLDASLHFTSRSATEARLALTVLGGQQRVRKHRFVAVRPGQEHAELKATEFIMRVPAFTSTSEVDRAYFLFALPTK